MWIDTNLFWSMIYDFKSAYFYIAFCEVENEGFCRIDFFTKMVIVFLKSLIFERLSFRFLPQEQKSFAGN